MHQAHTRVPTIRMWVYAALFAPVLPAGILDTPRSRCCCSPACCIEKRPPLLYMNITNEGRGTNTPITSRNQSCHSERSEESLVGQIGILRCAQNDMA